MVSCPWRLKPHWVPVSLMKPNNPIHYQCGFRGFPRCLSSCYISSENIREILEKVVHTSVHFFLKPSPKDWILADKIDWFRPAVELTAQMKVLPCEYCCAALPWRFKSLFEIPRPPVWEENQKRELQLATTVLGRGATSKMTAIYRSLTSTKRGEHLECLKLGGGRKLIQ